MTDRSKISELAASTTSTISHSDLLPVVDVSAGTTEKLTISQLKSVVMMSPEWFGAVGDGATDDTAAIQALATYGGPAYFRSIYKITTPVVGNSSVQWEFDPASYIDWTAGVTGATAISIEGTQGSAVLLASNATAGTATLVVASATGISAGTLLRVASDTIFDPARTNSKIGELVFVKSVSGTTITLTSSLADTYLTSANASVRIVTPLLNCRINNMRIAGQEGGKYQLGLIARFWVGGSINGANIKFTSNTCIRLSDCIETTVTGPVTEIRETSDTGYGVVFAHATRGCTVTGHLSIMNRHAVTTGNTDSAGYEGIPRNNTYEKFLVLGTQTSTAAVGGDGVDTHCAADGLTLRNGSIWNASGKGVNVECPNVTMEDIRIYNAAGNGVSLFNISDRDGGYVLRNIIIDGCQRPLSAGEGYNSALGRMPQVLIDGFKAKNFTGIGIYHTLVSGTTGCIYNTRGIELDATLATSVTTGIIDLNDLAAWIVEPNHIKGVVATGVGISISDTPIITGADLGIVEFITGGSNSSGKAFYIEFSSAPTTIYARIKGHGVATATNTAICFRVQANVLGLIITDATGNCSTPISALTGSSVLVLSRGTSTVATNTAFTANACDLWETTIHTGTLTANRAVTLGTDGAHDGQKKTFIRTGSGAFSLQIGSGPLYSLATGEACTVVYNGTAAAWQKVQKWTI